LTIRPTFDPVSPREDGNRLPYDHRPPH